MSLPLVRLYILQARPKVGLKLARHKDVHIKDAKRRAHWTKASVLFVQKREPALPSGLTLLLFSILMQRIADVRLLSFLFVCFYFWSVSIYRILKMMHVAVKIPVDMCKAGSKCLSQPPSPGPLRETLWALLQCCSVGVRSQARRAHHKRASWRVFSSLVL
jgi:hypothetical protein